MSKDINIDELHEKLTIRVEEYIKAILKEYGEFIPKDRRKELESIKDYSNIIKIHDYGSINGYASYESISLPLSASKPLDEISKMSEFGTNREHKTYNNDTLIINDNTFMDYIKHVIISGTDLEGYFEDLLLHETMHFCGSGGAIALKEGINELLTRKIALKKGFRTNGCGYPKEVKIAYYLQEIWGEDIINKIAFLNNNHSIILFLEVRLGKRAANLYEKIVTLMEQEFYSKYYKDINSYNGMEGVLKKSNNYKNINYDNVYLLIDKYTNNKHKK